MTEMRTMLIRGQAASLVIAAYNSPNKERANVVCQDTPDDAILIQLALTYYGGIYLMKGDYYCLSALSAPAGANVDGEGDECVIHFSGAAVTSYGITMGGNHAKLRNFCVLIEAGCGSGANRPNAIYASGRTDLRFEDLYLYGDRTIAKQSDDTQNLLQLNACTECTVILCHFYNTPTDGLQLKGACYLVTVAVNQFVSCEYNCCRLLTNTRHCSINGNFFWGNSLEGLDCNGTDHGIVGNVASGCDVGLFLNSLQDSLVAANVVNGNADTGISINGCARLTVVGNTATDNDSGIRYLFAGIYLWATVDTKVGFNSCYNNGRAGIWVASNCCRVDVVENEIRGTKSPTHGAIYVAQESAATMTDIRIRGNEIYGNAGYGILLKDTPGSSYLTRCQLKDNTFGTNAGGNFSDQSTGPHDIRDNPYLTPADESHLIYCKNTSGGDLTAGVVVVMKAVAAGNEFTTTTTAGDPKVWGELAEDVANNNWGFIRERGKTTKLKVNGTADIAIGDLLTTYTSAGISAKAGAGEVAFAMALEAYADDDDNGVIDALIITPRPA